MSDFIEKLMDELEKAKRIAYEYECSSQYEATQKVVVDYEDVVEIINRYAEEYKQDLNKNKQDWIACSERIPELHEEVLVTQFFDDSEHYNVTNASLISTLDGSGRVRWCSYDHFIDYVIAWQPLPQPYKEVQDDRVYERFN